MCTKDLYNFSRKYQRPKFSEFYALLIVVIYLFSPCFSHANEIQILKYGAWGLCYQKDPFRNKYPVVSYLPPGSIVFSVEKSPLKGYIAILSHYGHKLHIKEKIGLIPNEEPVPILKSIEGIVDAPPSNSIIFHKSILCLSQTNRLVPPNSRCLQLGDDIRSTLPVGKGWVYSFIEGSKGHRWLDLNVVLDEKTKEELIDRGLSPGEANFEVTRAELDRLEKQGFLTILDKKLPPVLIECQTKKPVYIKCGQRQVLEKDLKASLGVKATAEVSAEVPLWAKLLSGLKAKLGLTTEATVSGDITKKWTINVDTTNSSYLYYTATMTDIDTGEVSNILIEKVFECRPSPNIQPGEKINRIVFDIERPGAPDIEEYVFEVSEDYIAVPKGVLDHHPRPIFISVNSPEQHSSVLKKIAEAQNVDVALAHFMLSHINNTCGSKKRNKCKELIEQSMNN